MELSAYTYHRDCLHFRGEYPCKPHKEYGVHCSDCKYYSKHDGWILIIKLGAAGDVIRTTPLLAKLREQHPTKAVMWISNTPELLPDTVHRATAFGVESILTAQSIDFDLAINLDKDVHACALMNSIKAKHKFGFVLEGGKPAPANSNAEHKFITGIFDDANKNNRKSYVEEIFEICGWTFSGEEYEIALPAGEYSANISHNGERIVGLNTGCGNRWASRRWSDEQWIELVRLLNSKGYTTLLLGGKQEHELNTRLAAASGATYEGYFDIPGFIALVNKCDAVVTTVTMALHIAIALRKHVVLLNNIFNAHEFELYGRGQIIEPQKPCTCFFRGSCTNPEYKCMDFIAPQAVFDALYHMVRHDLA